MRTRPGTVEVLVHWLFVAEAVVLVATGLYLHSPLAGVSYGIESFLHLVVGYAIVPTVAFRVYWGLYGRPSEERLMPRDGTEAFDAVRRYAVYLMLWLCLAAQIVLGLALHLPTSGFGEGVMHALGGIATVRIVHYCLLWVFVSLVALHAYAGLLAGWSTFREIFLPSRRPFGEQGRSDSDVAGVGVS